MLFGEEIGLERSFSILTVAAIFIYIYVLIIVTISASDGSKSKARIKVGAIPAPLLYYFCFILHILKLSPLRKYADNL